MKMLNKALLALSASSLLMMSASAAVSYGANSVGQPYVGVKVGQFDLDKLQSHKGKLTAYGVYGGYNFDQNTGVELEYVGADSEKYKHSSTLAEYEVKAKTYGAYGTYRYHFDNMQSMPKVNWVCLKQKLKIIQPTVVHTLKKTTKHQSQVAWV